MQVEASASTATTPNPQYTDPTWLTDGGTRGRTDDPDGPVPVPRNYTSGASIAFGANVQVSFGGSLTASGTPMLVPNSLTDGFDIENDLTYTNNRLAKLGIGLHSSAGFYSGSGEIDSVVPVSGQFEDTDFGGLRRGPNPDNSDVPTDVPPIPAPTTGVGHSLGVSSSSSSNSQTSMDHRIGMRARLDRDGKLKALEGQMRNKAEDKLSQQGRDNNALTLRHEEGDALNGFRSVITTGRNANGNVVIDAANKFQAELELGQDQQATFLPDEVKTELDVGGSTGKVNFEFVFTEGWGEARTPLDFTKWESTIETKELKRSTESIDADAGIEDHTQLSAEATREGAFLNFESESYKSDLTLEKFFPEARANSREVAFDSVNMKSTDSWSFLSLGGGQIKTSAGQDGEVIASGGSSAVGIETLTYTADATRQLESIGEVWEHFSNENRNARFSKTIVTTTAFDPNNPDAVDSSPMIFGDDRVVVTGTQSFLTVRKMALGPRPEDVFREYIQSIFDLGTGERKGRDNLTNYTAGLRESGGMAPGGDPTPRDQWITTYEPNWDPRNFYEADLDGIPLPADRYLHLDAHLYKLPDGFVAPSSNTSGRTWTEWFAGQKGDAFDQSMNGISGFADGFTGGVSSFIRQNINPFGDYVDYESPVFVRAEIVGIAGSALANPTGFAAKGTAIYNLANKFDDAGRCANLATKVIHGGCFIEGTLVTVSSLPGQSTSTDSLWSDPSWLDEPSQETPWLAPERYASVATRTQLQVPIESVPIGSRVPTKNPNRFEVDPQPEPNQATWAKVSITVERSDGGIVDAEIIRPRSWILRNGLCAGRMLPLNLPELEVSGLALVTAIDDCPPIADGDGSVVTARFVTREVHVVASVDVLGADGTVETITGTTIHPVWSVDRQEWVPLAELADGERLQGLDGLAVVLSVSLSRVSQPVYNIEVHGEHVYQVGELGVLVHNTCPVDILQNGGRTILKSTARALNEFHEVSLHSREWGRSLEKLKKFEGLRNDHHGIINRAGDYLDDAGNFIGNLADYL